MTIRTKVTVILLLAMPLLLGAVASKERGIKNAVAPKVDAPEATAELRTLATPDASQSISPSSNDEIDSPTPVVTSRASSYAIDWYSINGGGTVDASSTNYKLGASVGQSVAGAATSTNYNIGVGFWYGVAVSGCTCPCWADPQCDGVRSNVQDVVGVIGVAFRGIAPGLDQGCPNERSDVNCSGFTNVQDVVSVVNVAFRGANAATEFCNPCP